ncbi:MULTISPECIES: DegV family protein [Amylolactobacillus]|nr:MULTISPECIES: DegV family protein [Amylolactobacillus]APT19205.1 fatty acid-binding protein DegV [Amylolactobacillus amylophilus DSM 20533 = JCM 1125]GED79700.1 hypothetical protein LAM01_01730 [Amylolactobacillus amylophilus]
MKIAVVADSASYLTKEQEKQYGISVIPIPIIWNNKTYRDMIDITSEEFYRRLYSEQELPTTSTPSMGEVQKLMDQLVQEEYTDVIFVTISSGLSSFYPSLVAYAETEKRINIHAFDSKVTCAGSANMAMLAAKLVAAGKSVPEIISSLSDLRATTHVRFMVDDLSHLKRTGRLSNAASFVAGMLKIKPILGMDVQEEGKISAIGKERQAKKAFEHIKRDFAAAIADVDYPVQVTFFDAAAPELKAEWMADFKQSFPNVRILSSIIGPVVGVHVGQGCIALIWSKDIQGFA